MENIKAESTTVFKSIIGKTSIYKVHLTEALEKDKSIDFQDVEEAALYIAKQYNSHDKVETLTGMFGRLKDGESLIINPEIKVKLVYTLKEKEKLKTKVEREIIQN